jgi:hypothetical protein
VVGNKSSRKKDKNMKKVILGAWFAAMGFGVYAQTGSTAAVGSTTSMPQVSTSNEVRQLANQLQLNEGQYIRLRDLSKTRQEQITEINSMYSNDPAMRQAKVMAAQQEFDAQLAQAVTQKQFTAYLQLQGRSPGGAGAAYQAGGYGGRSLEEGTAGKENQTAAPAVPEAAPMDGNIDKGKVEVSPKVIKVDSEDGEMKVKTKKEKAETADMEYKADRDETKFKSKDGTIKAKSEKGKTKIETPQGKMKMEDGEIKVKPKKG